MGAQAVAMVDLAGHGSICVPGGSGNCIHAAARGSSTRRRGAWLGVMHVADTGDVGAGRKRGWGKFRWRRARRKLESRARGLAVGGGGDAGGTAGGDGARRKGEGHGGK